METYFNHIRSDQIYIVFLNNYFTFSFKMMMTRDDSLSKTLKNGQELLVLLQEAPDSQSTLVENRQTIPERLERLSADNPTTSEQLNFTNFF